MIRLIFSLVMFFLLVGCGGNNHSNSSKIDFLDYMSPKTSINKFFLTQIKDSDKSFGTFSWSYGYKQIAVTDDRIVYLREEPNPYDNVVFNINDDYLQTYQKNYIYGEDIKRNIGIGDTIWIKDESVLDYEKDENSFTECRVSHSGGRFSTGRTEHCEKKEVLMCKLNSKIKSFQHKYIKFSGDIENLLSYSEDISLSSDEKELYKGDIIKVRCSSNLDTNKSVIYYYFQKNVGIVAKIQDYCYSEEVDINECTDRGYRYQFYINDSYLKAL